MSQETKSLVGSDKYEANILGGSGPTLAFAEKDLSNISQERSGFCQVNNASSSVCHERPRRESTRLELTYSAALG